MKLFFILFISCYAYHSTQNDFHPTGKYCGSIANMISITARVKTENIIDLGITIFRQTFNCINEEVILHSNNTITFPNSYARQNCIYNIFDRFGRTNIAFSYNSKTDTVNVNLPMGLLKMRHC